MLDFGNIFLEFLKKFSDFIFKKKIKIKKNDKIWDLKDKIIKKRF